MAALFALVSSAYAWNSPPSRRIKLWADVDPSQMPALFQFEGAEDEIVWQDELIDKNTLTARLFIYINATDKMTIGATQVNTILQAIKSALYPTTIQDRSTNRQSLGGLVQSCRIVGRILKDPGDLDGIGLLIIPIIIVMP